MMWLANRIRGTYGWFAAVFGVTLTAIMYLISGSLVIATLIGVGYWFGEMVCGYGDHIGNVTTHRFNKFKYFPKDGDAVGARWLTSMVVYPKLWKLHIDNAKVGLGNVYPRTMNLTVKGWSLARLFNAEVKIKPITEFQIDRAITYSRVFLVIRGLYWLVVPMVGVAMWIGVVPAMVALAWLSVGWVLAAEVGYWWAKEHSYKVLGFPYHGGWEMGEGTYGIVQDIAWIGLVVVGLSQV